MTDSYWSTAATAYFRGLRDHYEPRLGELRERCDQCADDASRARLEARLIALEAEYRSKRRATGRLLF